MAFHPTLQLLASCGGDTTLRMWAPDNLDDLSSKWRCVAVLVRRPVFRGVWFVACPVFWYAGCSVLFVSVLLCLRLSVPLPECLSVSVSLGSAVCFRLSAHRLQPPPPSRTWAAALFGAVNGECGPSLTLSLSLPLNAPLSLSLPLSLSPFLQVPLRPVHRRVQLRLQNDSVAEVHQHHGHHGV